MVITGYTFIVRQSEKHESYLVGTRITVSGVVRDFDFGSSRESIDVLVMSLGKNVNRAMIEEVLMYYGENKTEIDTYIEESVGRSGIVIRPV